MITALIAAIIGALGYGVGSVLQARAATVATGLAVLRRPVYLAGVGCDLLAWAASLVAVRQLPLFAVQSMLAASLGVTVVLARFLLGSPIRRRDTAALVGVLFALLVLALASGSQSVQLPPPFFGTAILLAVVVVAIIVLMSYRQAQPSWLALLAGACFAGAAIAARALDLSGPWFVVPLQPEALGIVAFGLIGSVAYARSLEFGSAGSSTAMVWVVEVALAGLVGITVLGDGVRPGWTLPALLAFAVALISCVVLGHDSSPGPLRLRSSPVMPTHAPPSTMTGRVATSIVTTSTSSPPRSLESELIPSAPPPRRP